MNQVSLAMAVAVNEKFSGLIDFKKEREEADPWIIAMAKEEIQKSPLLLKKDVAVVTMESVRSPQKIPAVCKHLNIP